jgi:23S rRNA pseudouridine1911/1915/1917 synthase
LHAHRLGFVLPDSGTWHEFSAPLPDDLAAALATLRSIAGTTAP